MGSAPFHGIEMADNEFAELRESVERWNKRQKIVVENRGEPSPFFHTCEVCGSPTEKLKCVFCIKIVCAECFDNGRCCNWLNRLQGKVKVKT